MGATTLRARAAAVQPPCAVENGDKTPAVSPKSGLGRPSGVSIALAFHAAMLGFYLFVWGWHFTPAAQYLPGSTGFGWFFRYLTFYAFTLQTMALGVCVAAGIAPGAKARAWLGAWADDLSCALFGLAHAVSLMYYFVRSATRDAVEGGHIERPPWLGFAVHVSNTMLAWADLILASPRSFSLRSQHASTTIVVFYLAWILVCRQVAGFFPYPFLNVLPFPLGFAGVALGGVCVFWLAFQAGKAISGVFARWK